MVVRLERLDLNLEAKCANTVFASYLYLLLLDVGSADGDQAAYSSSQA
jgi:hypothetical protein